MALFPTMMFFVVVAINLTPGESKRNYLLLVNGKEYDHNSQVSVLEGDMITITCNFSGGKIKPTTTRVQWKSSDRYLDGTNSSAMVNLTVDKSLNSTICSCTGHNGGPWLEYTTVTLKVNSRPKTQSTAGPDLTNDNSQEIKDRYGAGSKTTIITTTVVKTTTETNHARQPDQSQGNGADQQTTSQGRQATSGTSGTNNENIPSGKSADTRPTSQIQGNRADQQTTSQQGQATFGTSGTNNETIPSEIPAAQEPKSVQVENNNDLIVIVVPASICVVLALVVTLVIVVLVLRRKTATRNIQDKGEPTYAVVQDVETKRDYIGTNIDETYAVVNKKQKANKKDVGPQDFNPLDETYAAVNKSKKTNRGDTVASTYPVSNPMAQPKGMNFNMAALREEADGLAVYKKVQKEHGDFSTEDKTQTNSTEGSGRYLNEDGLVYVTVELNPVAPKSTIKPATIVRDERYEPVEYSTIVPGQGAKKDETNDEA